MEVGQPAGRPEPRRETAVEARQRDHETGKSRPAFLRICFAGDERAAKRVDGDAHEAEKVRRAPQGHVDSEQTVPEIVDRGGQHGQRDSARGQQKTGRAREPEHALRSFRGAARAQVAKRVVREHAEAGQHEDRHPRISHDVGRDPERVTADLHVPLDVPLHAPAGEEIRAQEHPQRDTVESE